MAVDSTDQFVESELQRGVEARLALYGFTGLCAASFALVLVTYVSPLVPLSGLWTGLCIVLVAVSAFTMILSDSIASRVDI